MKNLNNKVRHMVFVGDWLPKNPLTCLWGRGDEVVVGNLECALADGEIMSGKAYTSILPRSYIDNVAQAGFSALSLANNHVYDAGAYAFTDMRRLLEARCPGVQFFGTKDMPYATLEFYGRQVVVIGALEPCRSRGVDIFREEDVEALIRKIYGRFDEIYVYPHWGKEGEYTRYPSPRQQKLARRWIDAGADGVFGSHSHVFQGREEYNGKSIYYSLGNYWFQHPEGRLYEGTDIGMMISLDMSTYGLEAYERFVKNGIVITDKFEMSHLQRILSQISVPLRNWTLWRWARAIGPFNLNKNMSSWKLRLTRNFLKTLPKFLLWQFLPQTLLFRVACLVYNTKR